MAVANGTIDALGVADMCRSLQGGGVKLLDADFLAEVSVSCNMSKQDLRKFRAIARERLGANACASEHDEKAARTTHRKDFGLETHFFRWKPPPSVDLGDNGDDSGVAAPGQSVDRSDNGDSGVAAPEVTGQSVDRGDNGGDSGVAAPEVTGQSVDRSDNGGDSGVAAPEVTGQSVDRSDNGGDSGVAATESESEEVLLYFEGDAEVDVKCSTHLKCAAGAACKFPKIPILSTGKGRHVCYGDCGKYLHGQCGDQHGSNEMHRICMQCKEKPATTRPIGSVPTPTPSADLATAKNLVNNGGVNGGDDGVAAPEVA
jgi:hypothetical protein